jgi:hypothetical protein
MSPYEQETFHLSQKELQRVAVFLIVRQRGPGVCQSRGAARPYASAGETPQIRYRQGRRSGSGTRQPRPPSPPPPAIACAPASCIWPALATPASTITISARSSTRSKAFPSAARPCAVCCVPAASARPASDALPPIASAAWPGRREGEMLLLDASLHHWLEERGPQLTLLGFLDDATAKSRSPSSSRRRCSRLFPPAPPLVAPLRSPTQLLRRSPQRLHPQRRSLVGAGTARGKKTAHSVRSRAGTTRRHLHRRSQSTGQGPHRTPCGALFRIALPANYAWPVPSISILPTRPAPLHSRLQPPLRPRSARGRKSLAAAPDDLDRICCFATNVRQQRQRRAMGRAPLPDPAPAKTLQLRRR